MTTQDCCRDALLGPTKSGARLTLDRLRVRFWTAIYESGHDESPQYRCSTRFLSKRAVLSRCALVENVLQFTERHECKTLTWRAFELEGRHHG
jgi:hypothetical protein